jgi:hypothetical protein
MKAVAVSWSNGDSPEKAIETFTVASTTEAILRVRVAEEGDLVEQFLSQYEK